MSSRRSQEGSWPIIDRRHFLKMSGVGVAGAMLLTTAGAGDVFAQSASDLEREFAEAARRFGVPESLLVAMAEVNTGLEMPPADTNEYEKGDLHGWGSYGIMQLVQNPSSDTLGEASRLTGIPEAKLKTDRRSNILGGAALLSESQGASPPRLSDYFGAVDGRGGRGREYRAISGIGSGQPFAEEVFEKLRRGFSRANKRGERVVLRAQDLNARLAARQGAPR